MLFYFLCFLNADLRRCQATQICAEKIRVNQRLQNAIRGLRRSTNSNKYSSVYNFFIADIHLFIIFNILIMRCLCFQ